MNKIYGLNIDMLRMCFECNNIELINELTDIEVGDYFDCFDFYLLRIEGKHFEYVFEIRYYECGESKLYGELRFGINKDEIESNIHFNGTRKIWVSVVNSALYCNEKYYIDYISDVLELTLHNITTIDIAMDMSKNIPKYTKKLIRNKQLTTILNGKKINDRDEDRPEITYTYSGTLNKDKYLTVNIKQRKAIKDKSKGTTLTAYDKRGEILNSSHKDYIMKFYGNPQKLYRLEVHLNNEDIKDYVNTKRIEINLNTIFQPHFLYELYIYTLNSLIRFEYDRYNKLSWEEILS